MNPKVLTLLERARTLISNPDNWLKNDLWNKDHTCFCAMGALCTARNALPGLIQDNNPAMLAAEKALDARAPALSYIHYNDLESTTHADILRLFDDAIADVRKSLQPQPAASALPKASEPTPTPTPTPTNPISNQLRTLDEALRLLQRAQDAAIEADELLAEAKVEGVYAAASPDQWQAAYDIVQKRIDDLMPKFKAGDRVRIIESQHPGNIGALLTILGPVAGPAPGWYHAIADKPLLSVGCDGDQFGELHNQSDPRETLQAQVFCTKVQKVESIEDLINELVTDASDLLQVCRGAKVWVVSLPTSLKYLEAHSPDLRAALTSLRDKVKEEAK